MREYRISYDMGAARAVPDSTLEALVKLREGDAALVYLYLLMHGGKLEPVQAQTDLQLDVGRLEYALASLQRVGVLGSSTEEITPLAAQSVAPLRAQDYDRRDVDRAMQEDLEYRWLNEQAEKHIGRVLTMPEAKGLLYIRQEVQLPLDVTACLMTHMAEEARKKGKALSITLLQRRAADWAEQGVDSMEKAEESIRRADAFWTLWRNLGMGDRVPVKREEETLRGWLARGYVPELIVLACEETIFNTGKLKWAYAEKILQRWESRGYRTAADVERGERRQTQTGDQPAKNTDFASAEAQAAYQERMRRLYEQSRAGSAEGDTK